MSTAVVGGGLAGITAALRLADAGESVTLYESRPQLGGLTHSFRRGDLEVDNGQHVFLRCCTSYLALLDRLGVRDRVTLQDRLSIPVRDPAHPDPVWLRRNRLPAPLHLSGSVLRYRPLRLTERLRFATAALALRRVDAASAESDEQTFGAWLTRHGQSRRAIETLWDLVGIATLNATADTASLRLAATVFQIGLLTDAAAADIGWSLVSLRALHGDAGLRALQDAGVEVRTGTKATGLAETAGGWRISAAEHESAEFDQVVLAVPPEATERLAPSGSVSLPDGWAAKLGRSPIVNVHVWFDRHVMDEPFVAGVDTPVQWVFDRSGAGGVHEGQYLAVSLSAADGIVDEPVARISDRIVPALRDLLPAARNAEIKDVFVTRERNATFRPVPGTGALRPGPETSRRGLLLAGAWTDTGWPATMEGAVRSGEAAAAVALRETTAGRPEGAAA